MPRAKTKPTPFAWKSASASEAATELLKRIRDMDILKSTQDTSRPCTICEATIIEGQHYWNPRTSRKIVSHQDCVRENLTDAGKAKFDKLIIERALDPKKSTKEKRKYSRKPAINQPHAAVESNIVAMPSANGKGHSKVAAKPKEEYDVQEITLVEMNFKMGKTEGTLEAVQKENEYLRSQVALLQGQIERIWKMMPDLMGAATGNSRTGYPPAP